MKPRLQMQADNRLKDDGSKIGVELKFKSLDDFSPERVVNQIEPLRKLLEARQRLADLRNKMAGNDKFEELLSDVLHNTDQITKLSQELPAPDKERSEEHTSELQSLMRISYAVFCLKKKKTHNTNQTNI